MKIYKFRSSGDVYYVYSHEDLSSETKQTFEKTNLLEEILRNNEDIAFIIREHYYLQRLSAVYVCKYDKLKRYTCVRIVY